MLAALRRAGSGSGRTLGALRGASSVSSEKFSSNLIWSSYSLSVVGLGVWSGTTGSRAWRSCVFISWESGS